MSELGAVEGHAFISYVREDSSHADRLQQVLEAAGVRVWRDKSDLWPGEDWREKIRRAITDDALVFIACFSHKSVARRRSYQNEELALAIEQLRLRRLGEPWLIPVRFDDCDISDLDIGSGRTLTSIQRADLFGDHSDEGTLRLVRAVLRALGQSGIGASQANKPIIRAGERSCLKRQDCLRQSRIECVPQSWSPCVMNPLSQRTSPHP